MAAPAALLAALPAQAQEHMLLALLPHLTWEDLLGLHARGYERLALSALTRTSDVEIIERASACGLGSWEVASARNTSAPLSLLLSVASGGAPEPKEAVRRALQTRFCALQDDLDRALDWLKLALTCTPDEGEHAVRSLGTEFPYETSMCLLGAFLEHRAPLPPAALHAVVDAICDVAHRFSAVSPPPASRSPQDVLKVLLATHEVPPGALRRLLADAVLTPEEKRLVLLALAASGDAPDAGDPLPVVFLGDFTRMPAVRLVSADVAEALYARGGGWAELVVASGSLSPESAAQHVRAHIAQGQGNEVFTDDIAVRLLPFAALSAHDIDVVIDIAESFPEVPYLCEQILQSVAKNPACHAHHQVRMLGCVPPFTDDLEWFVEGPPSALARNPSLNPGVANSLVHAVSGIVRARGTLSGSRRWALQALLANPVVDDATKLMLPASLFWLALPYIPRTLALLNERLGNDLGRWATYAALAPDWEGSTHDLLVSVDMLNTPAGGGHSCLAG